MKQMSPKSIITFPMLMASGILISGATGNGAISMANTLDSDGVLLRSVVLNASYTPNITKEMKAPELDELSGANEGHFLIHYRGDGPKLRLALQEMGIRIDTYLPHHSYLVTLTRAAGEELQEQREPLGIDLFLPYHPPFKISPEVASLASSEEDVSLLIHLFPGTDPSELESRLRTLGLESSGSTTLRFPRVGLRLPAEEVALRRDIIAQWPEVYWLELRGEVRLHNDEAVPIVQSGTNSGLDGLIMDEYGLIGSGQIVGYVDTGLDYDSCFFRDPSGTQPPLNINQGTEVDLEQRKVIAYDFLWSGDDPTDPSDFDSQSHGTHVAGNIGGDDLLTPLAHDTADGMALGAKLVVQDGGFATDDCADLPALGCPVIDLQPVFTQAYVQGARIHTNSWGDNENSASQNNYSSGSEDVDTFVYEHPDFLLIFSAGNSGPGEGTVGSPSTAKNVISVGATYNGEGLDKITQFSSRGPATDGRLKPDLMAPGINASAGTNLMIGTETCELNTNSGTSFSAPLVAGAAAIVRQYFTEGYHPSRMPTPGYELEPSAALLKAMLINSATNVGLALPAPNFDQGWGRVALDSALPLVGDPESLKIEDGTRYFSSSEDDPYTIQFQVTSSETPLKVTLVWSDPPSTPAAAVNLVNDLDLSVESGRRAYLGNVFRAGRSFPGGEADRLNNVEQVFLPTPRVGTYTVRVSPADIAEGPQNFALVVRGGIR